MDMEKSLEASLNKLDPHLQDILRSHLPEEKPVHPLEHPPMEEIGLSDEDPRAGIFSPKKHFSTFIENSLPPGDRN